MTKPETPLDRAARVHSADALLDVAEKALVPFAELDLLTPENGWSDTDEMVIVFDDDTRFAKVKLAHFRRAREALTAIRKSKETT